MVQIHFWIVFFPAMFPFVKAVMSFSIFKGKCQPQPHQVAGCFSSSPTPSPALLWKKKKKKTLLRRRAPQSEERVAIELPYSNKWCLCCCWCRWLCFLFPSRHSRWVLKVTQTQLLFFFFFVLKMPSETRLISQALISPIPDHICAGSLHAGIVLLARFSGGFFCSRWNLHFSHLCGP